MIEDELPEPKDIAPVRLRAMTPADVAACVPLLAQLGYQMTADELARRLHAVTSTPDHAVLVAEIDAEVAGLLHVFARPAIENPREAVVQALVVEEKYRRGGVGQRLMVPAEEWGSERGCRSVTLSSNVVRAAAHTFYAAIYAAIGYSLSATARIFRKPLSSR